MPDASIVRPYLARGFWLWLAVRLAVIVVPLVAGDFAVSDLLRWSPGGAVGMVVTCALLGFIDVRRRGERALLANLGISDRELIAMFIAPAAVGELLLAIILPW